MACLRMQEMIRHCIFIVYETSLSRYEHLCVCVFLYKVTVDKTDDQSQTNKTKGCQKKKYTNTVLL